MQKQFQNHIAAVPELTFKLIDLTDTLAVIVFGDLMAQIFPHSVFHPSRIQKRDFPVDRNGAGVLIQKRIAFFRFGQHLW